MCFARKRGVAGPFQLLQLSTAAAVVSFRPNANFCSSASVLPLCDVLGTPKMPSIDAFADSELVGPGHV